MSSAANILTFWFFLIFIFFFLFLHHPFYSANSYKGKDFFVIFAIVADFLSQLLFTDLFVDGDTVNYWYYLVVDKHGFQFTENSWTIGETIPIGNSQKLIKFFLCFKSSHFSFSFSFGL